MVRTAERLVKVSKTRKRVRVRPVADSRAPCLRLALAKDAVVRAAERFVAAEPLLAKDNGHGLAGAVKRLRAARVAAR